MLMLNLSYKHHWVLCQETDSPSALSALVTKMAEIKFVPFLKGQGPTYSCVAKAILILRNRERSQELDSCTSFRTCSELTERLTTYSRGQEHFMVMNILVHLHLTHDIE